MVINQFSLSVLETLMIWQGVIYVILLPVWFVLWFRVMLVNSSGANAHKYLSFAVLIIATIAWPIAVPLSYWELIHKEKKNREPKLPNPCKRPHLTLVS